MNKTSFRFVGSLQPYYLAKHKGDTLYAQNFCVGWGNFKSIEDWQEARKSMQATGGPGFKYYSPISACSIMTENVRIPASTAPMPADRNLLLRDRQDNLCLWQNVPGRYILDMRHPSARKHIIEHAVKKMKAEKTDGIFLDNCYHAYGYYPGKNDVVNKEEWTEAFQKLFLEIASAWDGIDYIVNVSSPRVVELCSMIARIPATFGLCNEIPFADYTLENWSRIEVYLKAYEQVLESGKSLIFFTHRYFTKDKKEDTQRTADRLRLILALMKPLKDKYGRVYIINQGSYIPEPLLQVE